MTGRPLVCGRRPVRATGVLVAALLAAAGCGPASGPPRHVLLVTLDTTRADHLGCYGREEASTPRIDALAAAGVLFERCIAPAPTTLPSHASILTGLHPFRHGARNNGTHVLPGEVDTLAEILAARGVRTGAVVSARVLDATFGLDQGFERYDDRLDGGRGRAGAPPDEVPADDAVRRAVAWLDRLDGGDPFFLWVHLFDPHQPFRPPEPYRSRHGSGYDGEIAFADAQLGVLLDALAERGLADDTLVVLTADHGESLGEHGEETHGLFVYEATTHVPLVFAHQSLAGGRRLGAMTSLVDVVPTVLELLDHRVPPGLDGVSLAGALRGEAEAPAGRAIYSEALLPLYAYGFSDLRALTDAAGRYVRAPRPELYDHAEDPDERHDLMPSAADRAARYARELERLLPDGEVGLSGDKAVTPSDEMAASLAALGYVMAPAPAPAAGERPDPKDRVDDVRALYEGGELVEFGRFEEALDRLEPVRAAMPRSPAVASLYARALVGAGRREEARRVLREVVTGPGPLLADILRLAELEHEADPERARAWLDLFRERSPDSALADLQEGEWRLAEGDVDGAVAAFEAGLERDPRSTPAWMSLGRAQRAAGRRAEAADAFRSATGVDPGHAAAWYELGLVRLEMMRPADATPALEQAAALRPDHAATWITLGVAHKGAGRKVEAESAYRRALEIAPGDALAASNLARLLVELGRADEALPFAEQACSAGLAAMATETCVPLLMALRSLGRPARLLSVAESMLAARPEWMRPLVEKAVALDALGRGAEARAVLRRAAQIDAARLSRLAARDPVLARLLETS